MNSVKKLMNLNRLKLITDKFIVLFVEYIYEYIFVLFAPPCEYTLLLT